MSTGLNKKFVSYVNFIFLKDNFQLPAEPLLNWLILIPSINKESNASKL